MTEYNKEKIIAQMERLAGELRAIQQATEGDKDYRRPFSKQDASGNWELIKAPWIEAMADMSATGEDDAVNASKAAAANSHRAASALLDVYDNLGPLALALAVVEIRAAQEGEQPRFIPETAALFSQYYQNIDFPVMSDSERAATASDDTDSPAIKRAGKASAGWSSRLTKTVPGLLVAGASLLWSQHQGSNHTKAKDAVQVALKDSIQLRAKQEPLTSEQKMRLLELQEIEIPQLREKVEENAPGMLPRIGMVGGVLLACFGMKKGQKGKKDDNESVGNTLELIDSVIDEACKRSSPSISLSGLGNLRARG